MELGNRYTDLIVAILGLEPPTFLVPARHLCYSEDIPGYVTALEVAFSALLQETGIICESVY